MARAGWRTFPGHYFYFLDQRLRHWSTECRYLPAGDPRKNRLSWGAAPYSHGQQHLNKYEKQGKPCHWRLSPELTRHRDCRTTRTAPGIDEFSLAGALRGEPLEVVKCKTIDVDVPASANGSSRVCLSRRQGTRPKLRRSNRLLR